MTGRCKHCRFKTMALPGAQDRFSRTLPPTGFRLGWVIEWATGSKLICAECLRLILLTKQPLRRTP